MRSAKKMIHPWGGWFHISHQTWHPKWFLAKSFFLHCNCNCCFAAKACIKQPFSQFCGGSGTEQSTSPTSYLKLQGHAKDKDSTQQLTLHHEDVGMGKQDSKEPNQLTSEIRCNWTVKESARAIHTRANNTNNHKHAQKHTQKYIYIYIMYICKGRRNGREISLAQATYLPGLRSWLLFGQLTTHWSTRTHESPWAHLSIYVGSQQRLPNIPNIHRRFSIAGPFFCLGSPPYQAIVVEFLGSCGAFFAHDLLRVIFVVVRWFAGSQCCT